MNTGDNSKGVAWGISIGSLHWSTFGVRIGQQTDRVTSEYPLPPAPAAALLGWAPGELPRLDCWRPPHPRGTALNWPLDATVSPSVGSGRFPLAAAWTGRCHDLTWSWKPDKEVRQLTSLEAICVGAAGLASLHTQTESRAIVIPNDFKQREQQQLLDSLRTNGIEDSLIWLPVAAVLAWLQDNDQSPTAPGFPPIEPENAVVVHADWGGIRCSTLSLVHHEDEHGRRWMPARRRPDASDWTTHGFGWISSASCNASIAASVWHNLFGSRCPRAEVAQTYESHLLETIANWTVPQMKPSEVDSHLADHLAAIADPSVIIIVGDFAREVSQGLRVSRLLARTSSLVAAGPEGEDLLARGAAIFARDRHERRTSYLDTLPTLELFVDRNSRYDWLSLLGTSEQFVAGGQEWALPTPIEGLAVRRGASSIKLVVAHDEYMGVRELHIQLDRPAEVDLAASLQVHATPAQGNARLALTTKTPEGKPFRTVLANWEKMSLLFEKDGKTPLDKKRFEDSRPKAFPNTSPRAASALRWTTFARRAKRLLTTARKGNGLSNHYAELDLLLNSTRIISGASAVSSEGLAPPEGDQELVDELAITLFDHLTIGPEQSTTDKTLNQVIKTLGFMSVTLKGLDDWIYEAIGHSGNIEEPICIIASNCLRTPATASFFIDRLLSHIPYSNLQRLLSYQMQALGRLLSQRQDIMSTITEWTAYQLVLECLKVFEYEINNNKLELLFEHSGLVVVYALRYRIYNPGFLEPDSYLALRAKNSFEVAISKLSDRLAESKSRYNQRRLRPERVRRLIAALQQLIDYIDKRGEGDILLALDAE